MGGEENQVSLYVRVMLGFWTHRKTMRLRAKLGNDAFWIPPRLWSYAAENQPDGDFSGYVADELAMLLGYSEDASSMLQALLAAGFLDADMKIHGWEEHNGYHRVFATRAKKAAKSRWEKDKTGNEKKGQEGSIASSMLEAFDDFWKAYPLKAGKETARKAWKKLKCDPLLPEILTGLRLAKASDSWTKEGGRFVPHPATWLNRKGWEDDPSTWPTSSLQPNGRAPWKQDPNGADARPF